MTHGKIISLAGRKCAVVGMVAAAASVIFWWFAPEYTAARAAVIALGFLSILTSAILIAVGFIISILQGDSK